MDAALHSHYHAHPGQLYNDNDMTVGLDKLIDGYRRYRDSGHAQHRPLIEQLVTHGQQPDVAVVACSDSRVDPAILFQADPGDLFIVRNVANLVPPMQLDGSYHGTSAALEFAVLGLGVKHIVVLGHAYCGGVKLMTELDEYDNDFSFLPAWVSMLAPAHQRVLATMAEADAAERARACEQHALLVSLENLTTFPWVRERIDSGALQLHGWYMDISGPDLSVYDRGQDRFVQVD